MGAHTRRSLRVHVGLHDPHLALICTSSYPSSCLKEVGSGSESAGEKETDALLVARSEVGSPHDAKISVTICFSEVEPIAGFKQIVEELLGIEFNA